MDQPTPPSSPPESTLSLTAQAMTFLGPLLTCGGMLAIIRTGERSVFFMAMAPIGIIIWGVGFYLLRRTRSRGED